MNDLKTKLILLLVDKVTDPVRKLRDRFVTQFKAMSDAVFKFGERFEKIGKRMEEAGGWLTTRLTLPIAGLGAMSVRVAGQNEQLALSLESIAGSAEEAEAYLKRLMLFNRGTPFSLNDTVDAAASLRTAGYDEERTNDILAMTGEIAAKMKKPISEVVGLYLDMRMAGKVGASELLNMTKAQVPIVAELARIKGVSEQRIYQLADDGKISFQQMRDAMRELTKEGGKLHGMMEKYGRSIFGMFDELKRGVSESMSTVGVQLYKQLEIGEKIKSLTEFVRGLSKSFTELPKPLQEFIVWAAMLTAILGPIVLVVGQLAIGIGLIAQGMVKLIPILVFLSKELLLFARVMLATPIGLWITGIFAAAYASAYLQKRWSGIAAFFEGVWSSVTDSFSAAIDWIMAKVDGFMEIVDKVKGGFASLKNLATDNAVTRGWNRLFGDDTAQPGAANTPAPLPVGAGVTRQQVDTGGTMTIKVDQDGRVKKVEAQPNDRRMAYSVDTGLVLGGY